MNKKIKVLNIVLLAVIMVITGTSYANAEVNAKGKLDKSLYPWVGHLTGVSGKTMFSCTSILIGPEWVLTAAHCIMDSYNFSISFGGSLSQGGQLVTPDYYITNSSYSTTGSVGDIALLHLRKSLPYYFVSLPPKDDMQYVKKLMYGIGFGVNENNILTGDLNYNLQKITYNINSFSYKIPALYYDKQYKKYSMPCQGDSGGPLVASGDKAILLGITSYGSDGCNSKTPAYYTRVSKYLDWIDESKVKILIKKKSDVKSIIEVTETPAVRFTQDSRYIYATFINSTMANRYVIKCVDENSNSYIYTSNINVISMPRNNEPKVLGCIGNYEDLNRLESIPTDQVRISV